MGPDELLHEQLIIDHVKNPHARAAIEQFTARSHQVNPTCGDQVTLSLRMRDGVIEAVGWDGHGCSISQASASIMSTLIETIPAAEAATLLEEFRTALRSRGEIELDEDRFGDAVAFNGVSRYVSRVKCAMLAWVALEDALA